jgi:pyruvate formate lyase activating enzyme
MKSLGHNIQGHIFDIKRDSSEDGPGIRTTVFFKGCPISCVWCQNPEGLSSRPGISFNARTCKPHTCGMICVEVCETGCLQAGSSLQVNHALCDRCDRCFSLCPQKALRPIGKYIDVEDLIKKVCIDEPFFKSSGGGVTLSGGEPTQQMEFIGLFLQALKERGIHTALESCGFFSYKNFQKLVMPHLDLLYFDLKLLDDAASRLYTGQSNRVILSNLAQLTTQSDVEVKIRIPLVPNITDSQQNLGAIGQLLKKLGVNYCSLLPYNPLGQDKSIEMGISQNYERRTFMQPEETQQSLARILST